MIQRLKAIHERERHDFYGNSCPRCPHCAEVVEIESNDLHHIAVEGCHVVPCPFCKLDFKVKTVVSMTYDTDEQDDTVNS